MNEWYSKRIHGLTQWSVVRNLSGLIVERILVSRYPHLAKNQRSCHSCHFENQEIFPCGTCSKCLGVLLFLLANKGNPKMMKFRDKEIASFQKRSDFSLLRIDQDEKDHSFFLYKGKEASPLGKYVDHIEKIHIDNNVADIRFIPERFRKKLIAVLESYTSGFCRLEKGDWMPIKKPTEI
jgi:hypothetical protein